jgi:hypothetical protein
MRNVTDAFTNDVVLSPAQVRNWLPSLLTPAGGPAVDFLPAFLHEATHHWCFSSPVDTAVTLLGMRGRIEALLALEATAPAERARWEAQAAEDLVRADTALEIYRPLAEGLATFAEFDVNPSRRNQALAPPLRWAVQFLGGEEEIFGRRNQKTWVELLAVRLGEEMRRRKESLLAQPLSCQDGGGYLAGYLTVKMLWGSTAVGKGFWTADRLLRAAYRWFYEDEDLVRMLLDPGLHAPESVSAIFQYMAGRILGSFQDGTRLAREDMGSAGDAAARSSDDFLPRYAALWQQAFAGLPIDLARPEPLSNLLAKIFSLMLQSRDLMLIGDLPCTANVRGARVRMLDGDVELTTLPAAEPDEDRDVPATLRIHLGTRGGQRVTSAERSEDSHLLGWSSDPEWSARPAEPFWPRDAKIDSGYLLWASLFGKRVPAVGAALINSRQQEFSQLRELTRLGGYHSQTMAMLDDIYRQTALLRVPDGQADGVWSRMRDTGFYGLFDRDADAVRTLAFVGLYSSSGLIANDKDFWPADLTPAEAFAALRPYADRFGVFRVDNNQDHKNPPYIDHVTCSV